MTQPPPIPHQGYTVPQQAWVPRPAPTAPGGAPLADFGARLGAYLLDLAIFIPAVLVLELAVFVPVIVWFARQTGGGEPSTADLVTFFAVLLAGIVVLVAAVVGGYYWYFVTYQLRTGQTLGKRVLKIKVVSALDGSAMTRPQAVRRWLVMHVASTIAPYFNLVDGLWLLWDTPLRQCLHDKCAETLVVKVSP